MPDKETAKRSRRSSGAITLRDVAKLAGVAPITASRALNTPGQVSDDVLKKVKEAVERTGYVPNRMAGGLASARSRLISEATPSRVASAAPPWPPSASSWPSSWAWPAPVPWRRPGRG